jgi:hypothetical protein
MAPEGGLTGSEAAGEHGEGRAPEEQGAIEGDALRFRQPANGAALWLGLFRRCSGAGEQRSDSGFHRGSLSWQTGQQS